MHEPFTLHLDSPIAKISLHSLSIMYFLGYLKVNYKHHHPYTLKKYLLKTRTFSYITIISLSHPRNLILILYHLTYTLYQIYPIIPQIYFTVFFESNQGSCIVSGCHTSLVLLNQPFSYLFSDLLLQLHFLRVQAS